eukprot:7369812-Alexandrium_andersonii.AAC.1
MCGEIGHRAADCPSTPKNSHLQAVEPAPSQPGSEPPPENEWDFAMGLLEVDFERPLELNDHQSSKK